MALSKSKSNEALTSHVATYSAMFVPFGLWFAILVFITHWITDYYTSRLTSKLWFFEPVIKSEEVSWRYVEGKRHWFFVAIGFDQLIHYVTLAFLYHALVH